jgi:hypothetical protein
VTGDVSVLSGRHCPFTGDVYLDCVETFHVAIIVVTLDLPSFLGVSVSDDCVVHLDRQVNKLWLNLDLL